MHKQCETECKSEHWFKLPNIHMYIHTTYIQHTIYIIETKTMTFNFKNIVNIVNKVHIVNSYLITVNIQGE